MSFIVNPLYSSDGYKPGHKAMLAPGTTTLYGTWIPRSLKHAPKGIKKILSIGQKLTWKKLVDAFDDAFFGVSEEDALIFGKDMSLYLGLEYNAEHFRDLHKLGYLPLRVKALPEGIETLPNIPHQTFINTVDGFAWLTLFLETPVSNLSWKSTTAGTIALQYRRVCEAWVNKTDESNSWLIPYLCHDFSSRGLSGDFDQIAVGIGHASSFRGSDTLMVIPASRYYYNEPKDEVSINSVNASEHSVTCTGIFYYENLLRAGQRNDLINEYYSFDAPCEGSIENPDYKAIAEYANLKDWLIKFPKGILSVVSDTFDLWKLITYILPRLKAEIMARDGKLVIRPDSGDPVDIICGTPFTLSNEDLEEIKSQNDVKHLISTLPLEAKLVDYRIGNNILKIERNKIYPHPSHKGVIELLWDIFGGTVNEQGYKVLDSHIGAIYGDSINLERQTQIYERLAIKGFASTNIVLGIGSFTYQYNTRDTFGFAAKGAWFVANGISYDIFKDPITDDGTKKSLRGRIAVLQDENGEYFTKQQCTEEEEKTGILQVIFEDGKFYNETSLTEIRNKINKLI